MNAIKFFSTAVVEDIVILSGSVDQTLRIWQSNVSSQSSHPSFKLSNTLRGHTSSINCIAVLPEASLFASGAADATVRIWNVTKATNLVEATLIATLSLYPRFFPLALAISPIGASGPCILAVGGTKSIIQTYVLDGSSSEAGWKLQATLTGHESWVRSLAFARESETAHDGDLLLASASQDKYIRLWRIHQGTKLPAPLQQDAFLGTLGKALSNKVHRLHLGGLDYSLIFEALLLGHDDWIYTLSWNKSNGGLRLLSASADNSVSIWQPEPSSGIWLPTARLGEISSQKGSTTATGSTGGFWIGLWSSDGKSLVSLGRTGSWRRWNFDQQQDKWVQALGVGGHVKDARGIAWAKDGSYLLSTSADQTTRLHAEWKRGSKRSWHEFARPQIHGYDLNCVDTLGQAQFVSGADEKLLRVFDEPAAVADILEKLSDIRITSHHELPNTANMPVLGLSNKAIDAASNGQHAIANGTDSADQQDVTSNPPISTLHPSFEDVLSRHTLWPEREKLYGHGYEISALAASHDGSIIATACKASSVDHAVIRIYETKDWREVKPPLANHSLTITCLRFSEDDSSLLSGSRDRGWAVFGRKDEGALKYERAVANPKGHSRMILGAAWAPSSVGMVFATAGRDKAVKLWSLLNRDSKLETTMSQQSAVTSVDFLRTVLSGRVMLAAGNELGEITLYIFSSDTLSLQSSSILSKVYVFRVPTTLCTANSPLRYSPSLSVNQVSWRPPVVTKSNDDGENDDSRSNVYQLAITSEDSSLRVLTIRLSPE